MCTCLCRQCHECVLYILARKLCGIIITSTVPAIIKFIILWAPIYVHVSYITLYYLCIIVYSFDLYMFIFILVDVLVTISFIIEHLIFDVCHCQ